METNGQYLPPGSQGVTRLEMMAGFALAGLLANPNLFASLRSPQEIAEAALNISEAVIAEAETRLNL